MDKITISAPIFDDVESWLLTNLPDMSWDNVSSVYPLEPIKFDSMTKYEDREGDGTGKSGCDDIPYIKECSWNDHIEALKLLCGLIGDKKLFVGGIKNPIDLNDPCNWDVEVVDAYWQLVFYKEVIYG